MEIKERIDSCLTALESKRQTVDAFQVKVRRLIDALRTEGMKPGTVADLLGTLESVLKDYSEISSSCLEMVVGLREIGDHLVKIEDGRQKILTGVEAILENLTHLDKLAQNGMQVGTRSTGSPKRILLVRISPDAPPSPPREEEEDDEGPAGDTVIH